MSVLLMHPKYIDLVCFHDEIMRQFARENHLADKTPIMIVEDLPEVDEEGRTIFAFEVSAGEYHYWTGRPIRWEYPVKA
jgi:hypothetical protein